MKGFVLIELLIALAILSVVFFYLTPITVNVFKTTKSADAQKITSLVSSAFEKAKKTGLPQFIWGVKGSVNVHFDNLTVKLSDEVSSVLVNGEYQNGLEYRFRVYPYGIVDGVKITLLNNKNIVSHPLLLRFSLEQP